MRLLCFAETWTASSQKRQWCQIRCSFVLHPGSWIRRASPPTIGSRVVGEDEDEDDDRDKMEGATNCGKWDNWAGERDDDDDDEGVNLDRNEAALADAIDDDGADKPG